MIATWILYCLIVSASLGLAAFAGERALSQYRKPVRWVWVASITGSIVLPLGMLVAPSLMRAMSPVMSADPRAAVYLPALVSSPGTTPSAGGVNPATISSFLAWAWGLSVLLVGARLAGTYVRLRKEMMEWTPGRILDAPVLLSEKRGPAVIGIRRAVIVMPEWIAELEQRLLRLVFLHEREHQRAGDHRLFALGIASLLTMPWNPIMWWQLRRLRLAIEFDCDRRVLDKGVDPRDYADALLVVGSRVSGPLLAAAAFAERKPSVERRLRRMTEPLRKLRGPRAILATAVGLFGILFACGSPIPMGPDEIEEANPQASELTSPDIAALDSEDPSDGPSFIPYDRPPTLENPSDTQAALAEHYPNDLRAAGIGGRVETWLHVDVDGAVVGQQLKTSSGNPRLDEAAGLVVSGMTFTPAENQGSPTDVWVSQWITFGDAPPPARAPTMIVVDGVVMSEEFDPNTLDGDSFESVEIISGQQAVERYGERARAGATVITTKPDTDKIEAIVVPPRDESTSEPVSGQRLGDFDNDGGGDAARGVADGYASYRSENDPLIVVDGVIQLSNTSLEELNDLDIDHIEIIKGAAAEEAYGTRGLNGVVEITTKSGRSR